MSDTIRDRLAAAVSDRYRIEQELTGGGMGKVYVAEDLRHGRRVAIKVLAPALSATMATERFLREIEILARLQHPHILTLIDSGEVDGLPWYVMPFVEGQSLEHRLDREGALPVNEAIRIVREVAEALQYAHDRGVVHRDIKPGNVLLSDGHAVVADFGIASALDEAAVGQLTATGVSIGSPAYMSPEQATGEGDVDGRSDVYALGCVAYEMLAGHAPFDGSLQSVVTKKMMGDVPALEEVREDIPAGVADAVTRAMATDRDDRFDSAEAMAAAFHAGVGGGGHAVGQRRNLALAAGAAAVLVGLLAVFAIQRANAASERALWVAQTVAEIEDLAERGSYAEALALAREVEEAVPGDTALARLWPRFSFTTPIRSDPPGARVYRQSMEAEGDEWELIGQTPLDSVRFPGLLVGMGDQYFHLEDDVARLRFELDGHQSVELLQTAVVGVQWRGLPPLNPVPLPPEDSLPAGMVRLPGFTWNGLEFDAYLMDRYEVTNRDYQAFVDAGGYASSKYWPEPFLKDGRELSFREAMALLTDQTGRPGPSTWRLGDYPEGRDDYPVGGVSWYEAAAFARWAGKELPTSVHWDQARRYYRENSYVIAPRSNLGTQGPRPVGQEGAMTTLGVYDLAGNVREWVANPGRDGGRVSRGAAWTDAPFHVGWRIIQDPFDRDATNGIRLVRTFDPDSLLAAAAGPVGSTETRDYGTETPASDAEFAIYRRLYDYDPVPLNAAVEAVDTFDAWIRETVAFDLPYGERGGAYLYLPKGVPRPLQVVLYWGGSGILGTYDVDKEFIEDIEFLVRGGRAVAQPIWKCAFVRQGPNCSWDREGNRYRDVTIQWVKDLSRTLDYLETRPDVDADRVGFYGLSWGSLKAPLPLAVEPRIDVAALNVGGLDTRSRYSPEIDPINFVTRVTQPVLMLNGRYDVVFPYETSQRPMFELLGTDPEHKKFYLAPASHIVQRDDVIRETLDWFDRYLGNPTNGGS